MHGESTRVSAYDQAFPLIPEWPGRLTRVTADGDEAERKQESSAARWSCVVSVVAAHLQQRFRNFVG